MFIWDNYSWWAAGLPSIMITIIGAFCKASFSGVIAGGCTPPWENAPESSQHIMHNYSYLNCDPSLWEMVSRGQGLYPKAPPGNPGISGRKLNGYGLLNDSSPWDRRLAWSACSRRSPRPGTKLLWGNAIIDKS